MISGYIIMFAVFSVIGWIFETVFCSLHDGFYQNRGFLFGPVCPIYGLGATFIILIADWAYLRGIWGGFTWWQLFLIGYIASAILEYSTHYALEKIFHATWWDYKEMPLNLNGRICVPASTLFGISYVVIFKYVHPLTLRLRQEVPPSVLEIIAFVIVASFAVDTAITVSTLSSFEKELKSMDEVVNTNMDALFKLLKEKRKENHLEIDPEQEAEAEQEIRENKAGMVIAIVKQKLADMDAFRIDALNRVKNFNYPKLPKPNIDAVVAEIRRRNPFYKDKNDRG